MASSVPEVKRGHNGGVTESKADLVSIEVSEMNQPTFSMSAWARRTKLEKVLTVLLMLLTIALIVVAALGFTNTSQSSISNRGHSLSSKQWSVQDESAGKVCNSRGCISAAHHILENMDTDVDPCEDFYQYACGGFEKRVRIPDDRTSRSQFSVIDDELDVQLRDILEGNATEDESSVFRMSRDTYQACMDEDRLEEIGLKPILDVLKTFGGWPAVLGDAWDESKFNWQEMLVTFRKHGYSTDYLFDFSIATDIKNSTWRTIYFDQGLLGMSREYLIKGLADEDVRHYYNYMQKVAVLLGADPVRAASDLKDSLTFEIKLANASLPRELRRDANKLYHAMQLKDVNEIGPFISNWTDLVNSILTEDVIQVTDEERVVVSTPGYFKNLTEILKTEPKRNIANYMLWRVARASIGYLNKDARAVSHEFAKNITGKTATTPRWKLCVGAAAGSFSAAIGKMYVLKHFNHDAKDIMLEMVTDIRQEFKTILDEITWMDSKTKDRAHSKLNSIKEYIAYPEEILDNKNLEEIYKGLEIVEGEYFQNGIRMSIWRTNYHWKKLREEVDKTDWKRHANPAVVNAFYSAIENSIQFPAGILQGAFFSNDRPNYMNYGGIGWVIGHEITHGFDDQGKQYDDNGNLRNWWEPPTEKEFSDKTQCIIWQYGNYSAEEIDMNLNGVNTQGENIADNGGIKEAYRAYNRWVSRHGEEPMLPGISHSPRQLFWVSAANIWCSKYRPKALEQRIKTGAHSPGRFRIKGPFSNSREFAKDFECKLGSGMNPVDKCEVW
ncbi:hypothetical protein TCAL_03874 [Tigriopus californicus]|uniref:Uncharacterized protein n=1 Tax=Tigriopus californicus TaxID=6832 RepID=A0A553P3G5_TIGCA|nr:neprilysin-2-like [Tigriopus californicus]XP_059087289.1 neprilysin-2-like [Tigriopus californicus]TRY72219.1 hypothetical protein TCAL_03874 [Tigriopus californicus]